MRHASGVVASVVLATLPALAAAAGAPFELDDF
jgi:hypothetical protein